MKKERGGKSFKWGKEPDEVGDGSLLAAFAAHAVCLVFR